MIAKILYYYNIGTHDYKEIEADSYEEIAKLATKSLDMLTGVWEVVGLKQDDDEDMIVMHNILENLARLSSLHESDSEREQIAYIGTQLGLFYKAKKEIESYCVRSIKK